MAIIKNKVTSQIFNFIVFILFFVFVIAILIKENIIDLSTSATIYIILFTAVMTAICQMFLYYILSIKNDIEKKKSEIFSWLKWLSSFLEHLIDDRSLDPKMDKLQWWVDHTIQNVGHTLDVLNHEQRRKFEDILSLSWQKYIYQGTSYHDDRIVELKNKIDDLIYDLGYTVYDISKVRMALFENIVYKGLQEVLQLKKGYFTQIYDPPRGEDMRRGVFGTEPNLSQRAYSPIKNYHREELLRAFDGLIQLGYIDKNRNNNYYLTEKGKKILKVVKKEFDKANKKTYSELRIREP